MENKPYDLIVIGAGPGGYVCAARAARNGLRTAIVEKEQLGGTCLNRGCIPTKSLLHSAGIYDQALHGADFGVFAADVTYDMSRIYERKDKTVLRLRKGIEYRLKTDGVDICAGAARLLDANRLAVENAQGAVELAFSHLVIAVGSRPRRLPVLADGVRNVYTSDDITAADPIGDRTNILIVGAGVIGTEFATFYQKIGKKVTLIDIADTILPGVDRDLSGKMARLFKKRKVRMILPATVARIENDGESVRCAYTQGEEEKEETFDAAIVTVGRTAATDGLGLEKAGVLTERGRIPVDEHFRTNIPHIYAIGDVIPGIQLAHVASAQGTAAADFIAGRECPVDLATIPSCVYVSPEIASVGLTEAQAADRGVAYRTGLYSMVANGKSLISGETDGFVKILTGPDGTVIGAHILAERATDMIGELSVAVSRGLKARDLMGIIHPHPTLCEAVAEACAAAERPARPR